MRFLRKKIGKYKSRSLNNEALSELIDYMVRRTPLSNVIFLGNTYEIPEEAQDVEYSFIGDSKALNKAEGGGLNIINHNIKEGLPKIKKEILKESIVVLDSVLTELKNTKKLLKSLSKWAEIVPCILISTPNGELLKSTRGLSRETLEELLRNSSFKGGFYGYVPRELHSEKSDLLYIGGYLSNFKKVKKKLKVCAILATYNEEDIIGQVCKYLLDQGIYVHIVDNWSNDRTLEIVKSLEEGGEKDKRELLLFDMLNRKIEYSLVNDFDWYIHYDADEIREGSFQSYNLLENIKFVDSLGFNAIDHSLVDFRPTSNSFNYNEDLKKFFKYFEFGRRPGHFAQIKAWKKISKVKYDLSTAGGHVIYFEGQRLFPYKFLLRHYPLRSLEHMRKKIFQDRLPRFETGKKEHGWHTHYDKYIKKENKLKLWKADELTKYDNGFYEQFLLERLFGINIEKEL